MPDLSETDPSLVNEVSPTHRGPSYRLRCPDCRYVEYGGSYEFLASRQKSVACPNCNKMLGLSEVSR